MFARKPNETSGLDALIDKVQLKMLDMDCVTDQYATMVDRLSKLYKLKEAALPKRVSYDTWAALAGNLLGIILILNYEKTGVVTSKAIGFVSRLR